ncbi:MAG: hypothetical protein K6L80_02695 [Agarilytica sp.]
MLLHRSPALTAIYNEIKNSDRNRVLELGPMNAGCFQLFSELSCKIQVQDLGTSLRDHLSSGNEIIDFDVLDCLDNYNENEKFDVILAWDLFNYLDLVQIHALFEHLQPYCKANTLLYMLRYVEKNIPDKPRVFSVKDKYLLELSEEPVSLRQTPNYSTMALLKSLPGYYMQDTLLGQMGMLPGITEHVMRFSASSESKHLISKSESGRNMQHVDQLVTVEEKLHISPSIAEVMSLLQSDDNIVVLDLGSALNRPEDEIVEKSGAYFRIDLFSIIERSQSQNSERLNLSVLDHHMSRKFDVILMWDLFNYCTPAQIKQIDIALAAISHENTFLLSYMYTGRNNPERPSKFEVSDGNKVNIGWVPHLRAANDAITGVALLRLLETFTMDKTYAYREGMDRDIIEYIFGVNQRIATLGLKKSG